MKVLRRQKKKKNDRNMKIGKIFVRSENKLVPPLLLHRLLSYNSLQMRFKSHWAEKEKKTFY